LNIEYLRLACGRSILKKKERSLRLVEAYSTYGSESDIHKYSICNLQFSILRLSTSLKPADPD
jgi:hypothetical protein